MGNIIDINELKNHEFEQFISKATNKTPSGILHVYDWSEKAWIDAFQVPEGFQMDRFLRHYYPDFEIDFSYRNSGKEFVGTVMQEEKVPGLSFILVYEERGK